ncbi:DUF2567 domain-containing protein [Saccharopolyspora sp. SCSIO 74807]|uniref:DUF2567 domain-containing protein n=1 Tax=Saccharopolyspora sp. SCSIO 74807 TaxID=3118084 RepID=UPI0030CEF119
MPSDAVETGPEPAGAAGPEPSARIPRVVVRADLLPALSALSLVALLGLPLGWLWSRLAPPELALLSSSGNPVPAQVTESYHRFDAVGLFLLLTFAAGLVTAGVLWAVRGRRGPVLLIGAVLGSLVAAWLAMRMGATFAGDLYPLPAAPRAGGQITVAPEVSTPWAVLVQPLGVALGYGFAASWNGFDDLGRRP